MRFSSTDLITYQVISFAVLSGLILIAVKLLGKTDIPKIKNLPELPGYPVIGSLFLLGKTHARSAARLVKQFGPVFQVRLGNRVSARFVVAMVLADLDRRESYTPTISRAPSSFGSATGVL